MHTMAIESADSGRFFGDLAVDNQVVLMLD